MNKDGFPVKIFSIYVIFYAGQAMYNTYLNVFLSSMGYSMTQIGQIQSVATILLVLMQPVWGIISDKSKSKNQIVGFLALVSAIICLSYYLFQTALWLAICVMLFSIFFFPAMTLQDNYTLELLSKSKWDFGNIRLGGTLGYSICALAVGFVIGNKYSNIFWIMAVFFFITGIMYFTLPRVEGHRHKAEKVQYSILLKDKALICMIVFNITYVMGLSFYFQFYPVYFTTQLGASSQMLGALTFVSAMSEVPFFWFAYKLEKKFGVEKVMLFAGIATAIRWFLLFFVTNHFLILGINMLSGCGYVGFSYCLIKYINDHVPKNMRATAQSLNAILGTIFSRILFAPIGGYMAGVVGFKNVLLVSGLVSILGVIMFRLNFKNAVIKNEKYIT
ncbi:MAG: MFS transporter [Oscillospiraceae bacterium]